MTGPGPLRLAAGLLLAVSSFTAGHTIGADRPTTLPLTAAGVALVVGSLFGVLYLRDGAGPAARPVAQLTDEQLDQAVADVTDPHRNQPVPAPSYTAADVIRRAELLEQPESRALRQARLLALWSGLAGVAAAVLAYLLDVPMW